MPLHNAAPKYHLVVATGPRGKFTKVGVWMGDEWRGYNWYYDRIDTLLGWHAQGLVGDNIEPRAGLTVTVTGTPEELQAHQAFLTSLHPRTRTRFCVHMRLGVPRPLETAKRGALRATEMCS